MANCVEYATEICRRTPLCLVVTPLYVDHVEQVEMSLDVPCVFQDSR